MGFPIAGKVNVDLGRKDINLTYDANVFPAETNKIAKVGMLRPKKFLVKCNGKGHMVFDKLEDPIEQIKKLSRLRDKKIITEEEFEHKKKELLGKI